MLFNDVAIVFNELELFVWRSRESALEHYDERTVSSEVSPRPQSFPAVGGNVLSRVNGLQNLLPNDNAGDLDETPVLRSMSRRLLSSLVSPGSVSQLDVMGATDKVATGAARQTLPTSWASDSVIANEGAAWSGPREFVLSRVILDAVCLVFLCVSTAAEDGNERHSPQENELRANIIRAFAGTGNASPVEQFFWPPFRKLGPAIQTPQHLQMAWERWWKDIQTDAVLLMLDTTAAIDHEKWFAFCKGDVLILPGLQDMLEHPALKQKLLAGFDRFVS